MLRELTPGFFHQLLEVCSLRPEATLQSSRAQPQFAGDFLQSWPLTREKFLQNSFHLFRERFLGQLLGQLGF